MRKASQIAVPLDTQRPVLVQITFGGRAMLSKCANPDCGATFHYLGEGKLYEIKFDRNQGPQPFKMSAGRAERFWLCDRCSDLMTLAVDASKKVILMPLPAPQARAKRAIAS